MKVAGGGRKPVISNPVFSLQLAGRWVSRLVPLEIRVAPDWAKIWEVSMGVVWVSMGVYRCPYLGGGTEAKVPDRRT